MESADVPLSAKVKTEEVETDDDAEDESADVPLSAGIKTEEEAADISKMMPSWSVDRALPSSGGRPK